MQQVKIYRKELRKIVSLFSISCVFIFSGCKSDDVEVPEELIYSLKIEDWYTSTVFDMNSQIEVLNGTKIGIEAVDQNSSHGSIRGIELRNLSNPKVQIIRDETYSLVILKTESNTNENISFDVFHNDILLGKVNITLKVPYGVKKDGIALVDDQKLTFVNGYTPIDLEIYRLDGQGFEDFSASTAHISFKDDVNLTIPENYEIYNGNNFKLLFSPFQNNETAKTLSLYYSSYSETGNRDVFVKDIEIEVSYTDFGNCSIENTNRNILFPQGNEPQEQYNFNYIKENDIYVGFRVDNCAAGCPESKIFYNTQGQLAELQGYAEYKYNANNLLSESIVYSNGSTENGTFITHHYNSNSEKISKVYYNSAGVRGDSIALKEYANGNPLKSFRYNSNNELISYSESMYDSNGNLLRVDGSNDGNTSQFNYYVTYEYSPTYTRKIYPVEGRYGDAIYEDAVFFKEVPVITKRTVFDIDNNRIDFQEDFISYTEEGTQTTIEYEYRFLDPNNIYKKTMQYSTSGCN